MGKLERVTVTIPEEMVAKMRVAVQSGEYATSSEIVREALRNWNAKLIAGMISVQEAHEILRRATEVDKFEAEAQVAKSKKSKTAKGAKRL
jgi:antitoxin ParD1/3/4